MIQIQMIQICSLNFWRTAYKKKTKQRLSKFILKLKSLFSLRYIRVKRLVVGYRVCSVFPKQVLSVWKPSQLYRRKRYYNRMKSLTSFLVGKKLIVTDDIQNGTNRWIGASGWLRRGGGNPQSPPPEGTVWGLQRKN